MGRACGRGRRPRPVVAEARRPDSDADARDASPPRRARARRRARAGRVRRARVVGPVPRIPGRAQALVATTAEARTCPVWVPPRDPLPARTPPDARCRASVASPVGGGRSGAPRQRRPAASRCGVPTPLRSRWPGRSRPGSTRPAERGAGRRTARRRTPSRARRTPPRTGYERHSAKPLTLCGERAVSQGRRRRGGTVASAPRGDGGGAVPRPRGATMGEGRHDGRDR